jgi:hypothetical protein
VPRCGALSLLQKPPHYQDSADSIRLADFSARLNAHFRDLTDFTMVVREAFSSGADGLLNRIHRIFARSWASAVTRRPTPRYCAEGVGRPAPTFRWPSCHSADKTVYFHSVPLQICRAGPPRAYAAGLRRDLVTQAKLA